MVDNVTSDLIELSEAYNNYRSYMGTSMRWKFEQSEDPATGGYLYIRNVPSGSDKLYVVGTRRLYTDEDITSEHILDWILRYAKALVKLTEGNLLRKSDIIGIKNDGQQLVDEGKNEVEALQKELAMNGRWVSFAKRF